MFEQLTDKLKQSFKSISGTGSLSERNIQDALKDVRASLIEADVALVVVDAFLSALQKRLVGMQTPKGLSPYQAFLQEVSEELSNILGGENASLNFNVQPPMITLVAGLQGVGKTTSIAKLAYHLTERQQKKVLLVSLDVYRPAAIEQLEILAGQAGVDFFPTNVKDKPQKTLLSALKHARQGFYDALLIDTAGRLHVDETMMLEISELSKIAQPDETLFVVDAMSGQDAARSAQAFLNALPLTGIILTKADGDARGGSALSVRFLTGQPIKFMGTGEKIEDFEVFHPKRISSRILGLGDMMSLIEDITNKIDQKQAAKIGVKAASGRFTLADMKIQLLQIDNLGGISGILDKLPSMGKNLSQQLVEKLPYKQMIVIIDSMTPAERFHVKLIKGSRKARIAKGSGTNVQAVNNLLRQHEKMQKQMRKMGGKKMQAMMQNLGAKGDGNPARQGLDMQALQRMMNKKL